jgi:hypothetical protein
MRFSSEASLQEFLNAPGNARFSDRIVRVRGVKDQSGSMVDIFIVLFGVAGYVQHYAGLKPGLERGLGLFSFLFRGSPPPPPPPPPPSFTHVSLIHVSSCSALTGLRGAPY